MGVIEAINKYPVQESTSSNILIQNNSENDISNIPKHIYFPLVLSTNKHYSTFETVIFYPSGCSLT
jgi:hypothetical protein